MRPIFANSATVTVPQCLVLKGGSWRTVTLGVRFGVWVHPTQGPVLIDTGYGPEVTQGPRSLGLRLYATAIHPVLCEQPEDILARLSFTAQDVRTVFITHFHVDHISGLRRFPNAQFICAEWDKVRAMSPPACLRHGIFRELLPPDFADRVTPLEALGKDIFGDGSLIALPLPGHAVGHTGLIWPQHKIVYAADAQWLTQAVSENRPPQGPARLVYHDEAQMQASLNILRNLSDHDIVFCHDPAA